MLHKPVFEQLGEAQVRLQFSSQTDDVGREARYWLHELQLQRDLEANAYVLGGSNYAAPAQLIGDFLNNTASTSFGSVTPSYTPGVHLTNLATALPEFAITAIREAIPQFAKQIKGFDLADGLLTGVETRTSSPIRIKRDDVTLQSINTKGFPVSQSARIAGADARIPEV